MLKVFKVFKVNRFQSQGRYLEFLNSLLDFQVLVVYPTDWDFYALCLGRNSKKPSPNLPITINWVNES
ncbi:hypothetical protein BJP34_04935 [Moorena producens PAL-8-15-08-1]|uniref:Uncharacterized protein n=1 Tax=Moorena producens PAL-8-15-08-1 TaxID=1458985 RepID=A0A1D8TMQ2_9CYAN|nr:hypothetical protein BJP34_04935 [Moorena producens PAL-8-15-08-1]